MRQFYKKEIAYERVLFFTDAVAAIALTLLALELKLGLPEGHHIAFRDLLLPWHSYLAFLLSFINVAAFWRTHHDFFIHIRQIDDPVMGMNFAWLFCIVTLPFCTSLLSAHFGDAPPIFLYSLNIFILSVLQNAIWDYADGREGYIDAEKTDPGIRRFLRLMLNVDMLNGAIALVLSFFFPKLAFFLLFFKLPAFVIMAFYRRRIKKGF